MASDIKLFKTL